MISKQDRSIARGLRARLERMMPLLDMRVFGSRARGDADPNSDMDIFIEVDTVTREIRDMVDETAWEVGFEQLIHISPLLFSRHEIENTPLRSSPIVKNILREGVSV